MLDKNKTDPKLGREVLRHLTAKGVNTPQKDNMLDDETKVKQIESSFTDIMNTLGLDLSDDSLEGTPKRVAKMYVKELFWGLDYDNFPKITTIENKMDYDEMIVERNITSMSACEHHFVTIDGVATVAYIPNKRVLGLSKMNRIVEFFSRCPQVQERLSAQIFYTMQYILDTEDVAVIMDAEHYCVKSRGVEDSNSSTMTSKIGGKFKLPTVRQELFSIVNKQ